VIYTDEKQGGYTHISCIEGEIFFVKGKNVEKIHLPIDVKTKPEKFKLNHEPLYLKASNKD